MGGERKGRLYKQSTGRDRGKAGRKRHFLAVFYPENVYDTLFRNLGTLLQDQKTVSILHGHQRDIKYHVL